MPLNWIIQPDVFDDDINDLEKEIRRQGMSYVEVRTAKDIDRILFLHDLNIINNFFYGSLELSTYATQYEVKVYHTPNKYLCRYYYPKFYGKLFNSNYIMLPYRDFVNRHEDILERFGAGIYKEVFIRPDSGFKTFTGIVVGKTTFESDIKFIEEYNKFPDDELILISPKQNINNEYRIIMKGKEAITGSKYKENRDLIEDYIEADKEILEISESLIADVDFCPDPMWILDICNLIDDDKYRVLEVGAFSCSGLYGCSRKKVVKSVKELLGG